jgi:hypothetical protein
MSDDALTRRIEQESAKLLQLLQNASSTQLSEPALTGLRALGGARTSAIEAAQSGAVDSAMSY